MVVDSEDKKYWSSSLQKSVAILQMIKERVTALCKTASMFGHFLNVKV